MNSEKGSVMGAERINRENLKNLIQAWENLPEKEEHGEDPTCVFRGNSIGIYFLMRPRVFAEVMRNRIHNI